VRRLILNWIISALSLMIVANVISGFEVRNFGAALLAAIVIGLVNATLGFFVKVVTFPLTLITFGVFWFIINAVMLEIAAVFVPGFLIHGFAPAFLGAILLSLVNLLLKAIARPLTRRDQ
jgi:putative membrane protein